MLKTRLPQMTEEQFNSLTDAGKREYLLQLKQEECLEWQTWHSKLVVASYTIAIGLGVLYLLFIIIGK